MGEAVAPAGHRYRLVHIFRQRKTWSQICVLWQYASLCVWHRDSHVLGHSYKSGKIRLLFSTSISLSCSLFIYFRQRKPIRSIPHRLTYALNNIRTKLILINTYCRRHSTQGDISVYVTSFIYISNSNLLICYGDTIRQNDTRDYNLIYAVIRYNYDTIWSSC